MRLGGEVTNRRLIIFAKYPRAGEAKTRLVPPLTFDEAARLARSFLRDTLLGIAGLEPTVERQLYVAEERDIAAMADLVERMAPGGDRPAVRAQRGAGLGDRLGNALAEAFAEGVSHVCVVGTDHPTLPSSAFDAAFDLLERYDLVLGPVEDGGYYLLGLSGRCDALFRLESFSTPELLRQTIDAGTREGLSIGLLRTWYDVDDAGTLVRLWDERGLLPEGSETAGILAPLMERGGLPRAAEERDTRM